MSIRKFVSTAAVAAFIGAGALAVSAPPAAAYVACNAAGECWHADKRYHYKGVQVQMHPDDWYFHRDWAHDKEHQWRDHHEGRGYYRNGVWITF